MKAEAGIAHDLAVGERDERALRKRGLVAEPVVERDGHRLIGGHVRVALGAEVVRLAQELRPLRDRYEPKRRRQVRRRLVPEHAHLLDLAADLLEAEPAREGNRALVAPVHVGDGLGDAETQRVHGELAQESRPDAAAAGSR